MPGTLSGRPARSTACRAGFWPTPAVRTCPMITSDTCSAGTPLAASRALMTREPRSAAGSLARLPPNLPTAVRNAVVITTSFISPSCVVGAAAQKRGLRPGCPCCVYGIYVPTAPVKRGILARYGMMKTRMKTYPYGPAGAETPGGSSAGPGAGPPEAYDPLPVLHGRLLHVSHMATIGEMAAGVAHELNQPLTAIANYAQACERLLARPAPDLEDCRLALREITTQAVRASEIMRRLQTL